MAVKNVILKLDNGSRIGYEETLRPGSQGSGVILLPFEEGHDAGRVNENDWLNLRRLCVTMECLLSFRNDTSLKPYLPFTYHTDDYDAAVARREVNPNTRLSYQLEALNAGLALAGGAGAGGGAAAPVHAPVYTHAPVAAAPAAPPPSAPEQHFDWAAPSDWKQRVEDVIQDVAKALGKNFVFFQKKVEEKFAVNYYKIITRPMWFGLVRDNMKKSYYKHPQQAFDDIMLIWQNCRTYNTMPGNPFVPYADNGERSFIRAWDKRFKGAAAPSAAAAAAPRAPKRPAADRDLDDFEPPKTTRVAERAARPTRTAKKSRSGISGLSDGGGLEGEVSMRPSEPPVFAPMEYPSSGYAGPSPGPASTSQQPTSTAPPQGEMSTDLMQRLLEALGNLAADPESPSFQQMLEIIKASNNVKYDENGEMEVDLTDLDSDTLWKLHSMAKHLQLL